MKQALGTIADIYMGATLRERPFPAPLMEAEAKLMQLGDMDTTGNIQTYSMIPVMMPAAFEKFIIHTGDIVFRPRGAGIVATVMPQVSWPVIVTSPLMIIRPHAQKIDPHYLVWALTADSARRFYAEHSRGSAIVGIGKRDLDQMEIELPSINLQRKIAQLKKLESQEQQLLSRYQETKTKLIEAAITDKIHKEKAA
jgi:hypothetical protein